MLELRFCREGAKGLLMLLLLAEEPLSLLLGIDFLLRDLDREGDLREGDLPVADRRPERESPVSAKVRERLRELEREVPEMLNESPVR